MLKQFIQQFVKSLLCLLMVALFLCATSASADAQLQPRISPWLGMFDRPQGPLGNFHSVVRPQQQMLQAHAAQQQQFQAQQRQLQALQSGAGAGGSMGSRDLIGGNMGATQPGGGNVILAPPREVPRAHRSPAGYNQHLHYYPPGSLPRRPVPNFSSAGGRR